MAPPTTQPDEPYKDYKFRVKWDGKHVAGVSKISPLRRITAVVEHREGGEPSSQHKSPGQTQYESITLERGVTHDTEFETWANNVSGVSLKNFRKDILIEVYDEAGKLVLAYKVYRCWPSEYQALPQLDADANGVLIESLKLECEGWERDTGVA